jgi:DNA repair protein RadD
MFEERVYQQEAVAAAVSDLTKYGRSLWSMPTGSGKAYCLAVLTQRFLELKPKERVIVIIDQSNLVEQLYGTFKSVLGDSVSISIACKTLSSSCDQGAKIIIGTRQTLVGLSLDSWRFGLVLGDEVHEWKLPEQDREDFGDGQFFELFRRIMDSSNDVWLHGCTATPYRVKDGWIFGTENRAGLTVLFPKLSYTVSYATLFEAGHLSRPEFHKIDCSGFDRSQIEVSSSGEYKSSSASAHTVRHAENAVKALLDLPEEPRYTVAFCCDTKHCEAVYRACKEQSIRGYLYHSKVKDCPAALAEFKEKGGVLITVRKTIKGFDFPPLSCALLLSPHRAVSATIQEIGRVLRVAPGKSKAIIIDLVGNTSEGLVSNNLDRPIVAVPPPPRPEDSEELERRRLKRCGNWPECREVLPISTRTCPNCGFAFRGITSYDGSELGELAVFVHGELEPTQLLVKLPTVEFRVTRSGNKKVLTAEVTSLSGRKRRVLLFFPDCYGFTGIVFNSKRMFKLLTGRSAPNRVEFAAKVPPLQLDSILLSYKNKSWGIADVNV